MLKNGSLQRNVLASTKRILVGYSIGTIAAIIFGFIMGRYRLVEAIFDPLFQIWRPIPPVAAIPLMILWVGIGELSKFIVIAGGTFAVCLINVVTGIKNVPKLYIDSARILGSNELQIFANIILPYSVPYILSGMRTSIGIAFGVMVAAELIASFEGIGFMLIMGKNLLRTDMIFLGLILIGVMVYIADVFLKKVEQHFTKWMERA
nr:ABC transporter permease [Tepidanaerobacter acetatoxydans]